MTVSPRESSVSVQRLALGLNVSLPWLYDAIEPLALEIASRAARAEVEDDQRRYLVDVGQRIVQSGQYRTERDSALPRELDATVEWFHLLDRNLESYLAGSMSARDIIVQAPEGLWTRFQADEPICAAWAEGVARTVRPILPGRRVLELGAGTGGTTKRLATDLRACEHVTISDIRSRFLEQLVDELPDVPLDVALVDVNVPNLELGSFDVIFATNCLHVARDVSAALTWLRDHLRPGGILVLGEGSHYSLGVPSPLSLILALFDGWWDTPRSRLRPEPGFLLPQQWLRSLVGVGYRDVSAEIWGDQQRYFGGVFCAFT